MTIASSLRHADHSDAIASLARVGYAAKGLVYLLIGGLAAMVAFGVGGQLSGSKGAIKVIAGQPFGQFLLWATAFGLAAYALWRGIQAIFDPEGTSDDAKNIVKRLGYAVSGIAYGGLGVATVQMAMGGSGGGDTKQTYLAKIMNLPGGQWIVGIIALIVAAVGMQQFYKGYTEKFMEILKTSEMSSTEQTWARRVGKIGLMARGVVLGIMSYFLLIAASSSRSSEVKDVGGALRSIASKNHGVIMLAIVALGVVAYAIHLFSMARYRRIDAHLTASR